MGVIFRGRCNLQCSSSSSVTFCGRRIVRQVSLFVAGAPFGEIWNGSRSAKCCIFPRKKRMVSAKSNLSCAAGCGLMGSRSDHSRIMVDRPHTVHDISAVLTQFLSYFGLLFLWQAQYLVMLEGVLLLRAV